MKTSRWLTTSAQVAVALALLALFVKTADEVVEDEWSAVDRSLLLAMHRLASPAADLIMRTLTFIGSGFGLIPLALVAGLWCIRRGQARLAFWLWGVAAVTELLDLALKLAFARVRPSLWPDVLHLATYSFPSGHAMSSAATLGMIAVVIARLAPRWRVVAAVVTPLVVVGIGLSRIYLGVHWPSDVLGGWAAGSLMLLLGAVLSSR